MVLGDVKEQDFAVSSLRRALRFGKVATAYLLHGPAGVGKRTTALAFAKALNCAQASDDACGECPACRRIERGIHPDVTTVGLLPGRTRLLIEQIKEIERELVLAPFEARRRVYILEQVELMSPEATGAILKTLEEPPRDTVFMLLTDRPAVLAPTIVSRCQSLRFAPLKADTIQFLLEKNGMAPEMALVISRLAQGSMERALGIDQEDFLQRRRRLAELYCETSPGDIVGLHEAISELLGKKGRNVRAKENRKQKASETLEIMLSWCRDILLARCGASETLFVNNDMADEIREEASHVSYQQAQELVRAALDAVRRVERNVAPEAAVQAMFLRLSSIRASGELPVQQV